MDDATTLTHRRKNAELNSHVKLFAESGNEHYGDNVWTLGTDLPSPSDIEGLAEFANDFFDCEDGADIIDPDNIVDSAQAWDDPQFVSDVWQRFELVGVRTQDGAVVLDLEAVELAYHVDTEDW